jgi:hypothetical protein
MRDPSEPTHPRRQAYIMMAAVMIAIVILAVLSSLSS